jgi:tRNA threonylcarbamoyladenosine biosynthesis protein TsaE
MSQHQARLTLYHVDLYRLESASEIDDLGLDEYLWGDGICVVEWAEKAPGLFPEEHLRIELEHLDESQRRIAITASGRRYRRALTAVESTLADER